MKYTAIVAMSLSISGSCAALGGEEDTSRLRVLYVGNKDTDRGRAYAKFLGEKFNFVGARDRNTFDPQSDFSADVVVLDWSQSDIEHPQVREPGGYESHLKSPLGERARWGKPTVLLGSAGHLLAAPWKTFGGSG
jgi:hypothetical protein